MDPDRLTWAAVALAWLAAAILVRRSRPAATLSLLVTLTWLASGILDVAALWHRGPLIHLLLAAGAWWPRSRTAQAVVIGGYALSASPIAWPIAEVAVLGGAAVVTAAVAERAARPVSLLRRGPWQVATTVAAVAFVVPPVLAWAGVGARWSATVLLGYSVGLVVIALLVTTTVRPWSRPWATDLAVDLGPETTSDLWAELARADLEEATRAAAGLRARLEQRQRELHRAVADTQASWQRLADSEAAARSDLAERIESLTAERLAHVITEVEEVTGSTTGGVAMGAHRAGVHLARAREELDALGRGLLGHVVDDGLTSALRRLAIAATVPVHVDAPAGAVDDVPTDTATTAYFVAAEAVTNAIKHARAHTIAVTTARSNGCLEISVADDGVGGASVEGAGLAGVRDRVLESGGTLEITSPSGGGTTVRARLPVDGSRAR